jgi:hypothetical protein
VSVKIIIKIWNQEASGIFEKLHCAISLALQHFVDRSAAIAHVGLFPVETRHFEFIV